ncbi:LLM class F420-dependent oxidoreductase, partial [Actinomadura adrarensis]
QVGTAAQADERIAFVRERAGDRFDGLELSVLIQMVQITPDRRAAAGELAQVFGYMAAEEILECPYVLLGTVEQIAEQLRERRERYGFSYITVHAPFMEAFGPVVEHLGGTDQG